MGLSREFLTKLQTTLSDLFRIVRELHDREWHGGYFCVANRALGLPHAIIAIGEAPPEEWPKYLKFCQEKPMRLSTHPEHWSSAQSRDVENKRYAGAVRAGNLLLAFSGLPEQLDEALVLAIAVYADLLTEDAARRIASVWNNEEFDKLLRIATGRGLRRVH
jgi:hypothetical protein